VWLWDLATGKLTRKLSDFADVVEGVAFTPDGSLVIAGSRDGSLRAYATSGTSPLLDTTSPTSILALAVSPDGRSVAAGGVGEIDLWTVGTR
jgi:WD40 repeat protein